MKQLSLGSLARGVMMAGSLLTVLVWTSVTVGEPSPQDARHSVKDWKFKVSPNGRYFVNQDGKPFFYLGDTCWLVFQRLNRQEVDEYLKDRAAKGFTVIQAYVIRGLDSAAPGWERLSVGREPLHRPRPGQAQ